MKFLFKIILLTGLAGGFYLVCQESRLSGLEIIDKVYNRAAENDLKSTLTMTLINSAGQQRVRKIMQFSKRYGSDEKKIMFFVMPADVRNTSFMTWSYADQTKSDDQWIYLPALGRIKRIASDSKSDYFMGSDFTFDDLGDRHPGKDTHTIVKTEIYNNEECLVVESRPKETGYMYSRTVTWVIKDKWIDIKKEFYDESDSLLKILTAEEYSLVKNYWIITGRKMHNIRKKHTTLMKLSEISIDTGLDSELFTERMMKRGM
ncbi:MAG: hypothetical protein A2096_05780 [Spirochaetes bacterium GWF1_41_5]|nr:MAG: hypothetical protein A2096_05780 [Spirochaetes bacterium GWF1_41_5]HBE04775.1 outer membrane lipoprotein-sorting protein [Spirochaetia bacterium]